MKKSDLKTGMRFITRDEDEYIVLCDVITPYMTRGDMYISIRGGWMSSDSYNEDLTVKKTENQEFDIIEVYAQNQGKYIDTAVLKTKAKDMDLIWKREDKKEMTISEIEKELGYSIKIVKEN